MEAKAFYELRNENSVVGRLVRAAVLVYSIEFLSTWLLYPLGFLEGALRLGPRTNYYTDSIFYIVARKPGDRPEP